MGAAMFRASAAANLAPGINQTNSISDYESDSEFYDAHSDPDEIMVPTPPLSTVVTRTVEAEGAIL